MSHPPESNTQLLAQSLLSVTLAYAAYFLPSGTPYPAPAAVELLRDLATRLQPPSLDEIAEAQSLTADLVKVAAPDIPEVSASWSGGNYTVRSSKFGPDNLMLDISLDVQARTAVITVMSPTEYCLNISVLNVWVQPKEDGLQVLLQAGRKTVAEGMLRLLMVASTSILPGTLQADLRRAARVVHQYLEP